MLLLKEEWGEHPKMLKAMFLAGPGVRHFWVEMLTAGSKTDGVIEEYMLPVVAAKCGITDMAEVAQLCRALTDCWTVPGRAGLFHDAESLAECAACKEALGDQGHSPSATAWVGHDFLVHNPPKKNKTPLGQKREKRKNDLNRNSKGLRVQIYERDRGLCRYCGIRPNPDTIDYPDSLEVDHIDPACFSPNYGNFLDGIVVACKACNRRKSERTPEEAGMPLLAIGDTAADVAAGRARFVTTPSEIAPEREGGRPGSGPAPARIGAGSVRDRSGKATGTERKGRAGTGRGAAGPKARARPP